MPFYSEHLAQAKSNLKFLEEINNNNFFWDWKVTVCFYSALHLINAHINKKTGLSYKSHEDVSNAINPNNMLSPCKLQTDDYVAYISLQNLSRRSRYLLNEKNKKNNDACLTSEKHYIKALNNLQKIIDYFEQEYNEHIDKINIFCPNFKSSFSHFIQ